VEWFGTYDEKWKAERKPELPLDFRFDAYNGADLTMQGAPYLVGNEVVKLTNVMQEGGRVEFELPGLRPRLVVSQGSEIRDLPGHLDTLVLSPDTAICSFVWRATCALAAEDARDVCDLRIEYETSRPTAHPEAS
jgi:hypothetical protein